jgi:hypothetical protein
MLDQGNVLDRIRLDYGSGTVQSDRQPHNHHRSLPPSSVSCPADLPSPMYLSPPSLQPERVSWTFTSTFSRLACSQYHLCTIYTYNQHLPICIRCLPRIREERERLDRPCAEVRHDQTVFSPRWRRSNEEQEVRNGCVSSGRVSTLPPTPCPTEPLTEATPAPVPTASGLTMTTPSTLTESAMSILNRIVYKAVEYRKIEENQFFQILPVGLSFLAFSFFFSLLFFYHAISSFQSDTFGRIPHLKPSMSSTRDPSTLVAFFRAFDGADSPAASSVLPGSSAPIVPVNGRGSVYPHPDDRPVACYLTYPFHVSMTPLTSLNTTLHD